MRSVSARSSRQESVRVAPSSPSQTTAGRSRDRGSSAQRSTHDDREVEPAAGEPARPRDAVGRVEHRGVRLENSNPRNRTTASQNHSGSAIERARSVAKSRDALGGHEPGDVARPRADSASGRHTISAIGRESTGDREPTSVRRAGDVAGSSRRPSTMPSADDRLVWIDLEMTGLDIDRHVIVEIACLVTDSELELVDDGIDIVVHAGRRSARARWTTSCARCTRSRACSPQIQASTVDLADRRAARCSST